LHDVCGLELGNGMQSCCDNGLHYAIISCSQERGF
jgi:hypothetical protein